MSRQGYALMPLSESSHRKKLTTSGERPSSGARLPFRGSRLTPPAASVKALTESRRLLLTPSTSRTLDPRVLKIGYAPGAKGVMHQHPDSLAVFLAASKVRFAMPDGKSEDSDVANESAQYTPAGTHNPTNVGTARVDALLVEFKAAAPGKAALPASREGMTLKVLLTRKSIRVIDRPDSVGDPPSPCRRTG